MLMLQTQTQLHVYWNNKTKFKFKYQINWLFTSHGGTQCTTWVPTWCESHSSRRVGHPYPLAKAAAPLEKKKTPHCYSDDLRHENIWYCKHPGYVTKRGAVVAHLGCNLEKIKWHNNDAYLTYICWETNCMWEMQTSQQNWLWLV